MPEAALGFMLRRLREKRDLSFREVARLAEIDHAYIYRLETGGKESPSAGVLSKLTKALKAEKRESEMLHYLSEHPTTPTALVELTLDDRTVSYPIFAAVAGMSFRGKQPDYKVMIERVRDFLKEEDGDG
jgi:transcriptional regulator with XRE-family HTH domain